MLNPIRCIQLLLLLIPGFFMSGPLKATHIVGADLTYSCVNNCTIRVELTIYQNCTGTNIPLNALQFSPDSGSCALPTPVSPFSTIISTELTPTCPGLTPTTCLDPWSPYLGFNESIVTRDYDICGASQGCKFFLSWYTCCRGGGNVSIGGTTTMFIQANVNTTLPTCNSSPEFTDSPMPYICAWQTTTMFHGAIDPDGDSLSYSLGSCLDGIGNPTTYNPGFNPPQSFGSVLNLSIDPATGMVTFAPNQYIPYTLGTYCVIVEEWRNGQLLGTVMREYALPIVECPLEFCAANHLYGKVYHDENSNCIADAPEPGMVPSQVMILPDSFIVPADLDGSYEFYADTGTYIVQQIPYPSNLWQQTCPTGLIDTVQFAGIGDTIDDVDFGNEIIAYCPQMQVDIGLSFHRVCFQSTLNVSYCNQGTDTAFNAYVDIELDSLFTFLGSTHPMTSVNNNVVHVDLGTVPPSFCGFFTLTLHPGCNLNLVGRTYCIDAHIYPDSSCFPPNPAWDQSDLDLSGYCQGDSTVCFLVENQGSAMQGPSAWRLYENGSIINNGTVQLCAGCDSLLCFPSNGNTFRLEVDQRPGHPNLSKPSLNIELCGTPNQAIGQFNLLPHPDADLYRSIVCRRLFNSCDPNQKYVTPEGVDSTFRYIDSTDILKYRIDFQNVGTANAITVRLLDTLPPQLDITTFQPGTSSHPYSWQIKPGRVLEVTFNNIQLVPESVDSMLSIGYMQFTIDQVSGLPTGTRIENFADIYFDFNAPIRTNTIFNTIGWPVVVAANPADRGAGILVYPNPTTGEVYFEVEDEVFDRVLQFEVYTVVGQQVARGSFETGQRYRADLRHLTEGVYLYRIREGDDLVKTGKLLLK